MAVTSPDLIPIEYLWDKFDWQLRHRQFRQTLQDEWARIHILIQSMGRWGQQLSMSVAVTSDTDFNPTVCRNIIIYMYMSIS